METTMRLLFPLYTHCVNIIHRFLKCSDFKPESKPNFGTHIE